MKVFDAVQSFFDLTADREAPFNSDKFLAARRVPTTVDGMELTFTYSYVAGGGYLYVEVGRKAVVIIYALNQGYHVKITTKVSEVTADDQPIHYTPFYHLYQVDEMRDDIGWLIIQFYSDANV